MLGAGIATAVAAIVTVGFLMLQWRTSTIREAHSDWRTSALEVQAKRAEADLELARAEIAKANAQAAEANAQVERLRKISAARDIDEDKFVRALQGKPKAPVQIWYLADASDTWVFRNKNPKRTDESRLAMEIADTGEISMGQSLTDRTFL